MPGCFSRRLRDRAGCQSLPLFGSIPTNTARTVRTASQSIKAALQQSRPELANCYNSVPGRAFVLWLAGTVGTAAAEELALDVADWITEHLRTDSSPIGGTVRLIYGEDESTLAEVPIVEAYDTDE